MGAPRKPDARQLADLQKATQDGPVIEKEVKVGADGKFAVNLKLRQNDVYLVELSRH